METCEMASLSFQGQLSELDERVQLTLQQSGHQLLRQVRVCESRGTVTLSGDLPTFYMKQMAQTIVGNVEGVYRVDNRISVPAPHGRQHIAAPLVSDG